MNKKSIFKFIFLLVFSLVFLSACSPKYKGSDSALDRRVHIFAVRQAPLQPTYNRLKTVHLASPLPSRLEHPVSNRKINPVFQFEAEDSTFEEVSLILGNTVKYSSYCEPSIAKKKVSIITLGTIDEIASEIEKETGVTVKIDHERKEVKVLK